MPTNLGPVVASIADPSRRRNRVPGLNLRISLGLGAGNVLPVRSWHINAGAVVTRRVRPPPDHRIVAFMAAVPQGQGQEPSPAASTSVVPPNATGEIYRAACATCHGMDGTGVSRELVGFAQELPDFTNCTFATPEPSADWAAVVHEGGPIRGLIATCRRSGRRSRATRSRGSSPTSRSSH